ncbi:MAG TPA: stalk domain-containing protein [bacterium]|jgi:hypothetical protein|nr:stalk domain-containing protein [bacterium]
MRRKLLTTCLMVLLVMAMFGTAQGANLSKTLKAVYRNIAIVIDSKVNVPSEEPFIVDGHVYVPLRYISEALGAQVHWDNANSRVVITTAAKSDPNAEQAKWQEGFNAGLVQGQLSTSKNVDKAYDDGYKDGFDKGKKEGYDEGYEDGYDKSGRRSSSSRGDYRDGESDGYSQGRKDGRAVAREANSDKEKGLDWKEALQYYIGIRHRQAERDIIYEYEDDYDLDTRRYPDYTDGFIDGYLEGFQEGFEDIYDH